MFSLARRMWTCVLMLVLCLCGLIAGVNAAAFPLYGADANPTGEPLGGGAGYSKLILAGTYEVANKDQLLSALSKAKLGEIIYILPKAEIDFTGMTNINIPGGIIIAGNRGQNGSPGPLLYTDQLNTLPLFQVMGEGTRVTGIRLRGPDPAVPDSIGINLLAGRTEVDNCEIYNWSQAGVSMMRSNNNYIHHNYIHDVRRPGLGYPVVLNMSTALIEANIFDYYRHAIAATGRAGTGYEARYNLVLEHGISHAFDMHGGSDFCPKDTTPCTDQQLYRAGDYVYIHHNTFMITLWEAIRLRGVPSGHVDIHHNWFINPNPARAVRYFYYWGGNADVYQNVYGSNQQLIEVSVTPSPYIYPEGSMAPIAFATGNGVSFGFTSPSATTVNPTHGILPIEAKPIKIDDSASGKTEIKRVDILLDNKLIYSKPTLPAPGELSIDTTNMIDGSHELQMKLLTNLGFPVSESVYFQVNNTWDITDEMMPPTVSGWLGLIENSRTSSTSEGWTYATETPADFNGDIDRRVRTSLTPEFLIWNTPLLQHFSITAYAKSGTTAEITLWVSADGTAWRQIAYQVQKNTPNAAGWQQLQLSGALDKTEAPHWFKLMLSNGAAATDVQISQVNFHGLYE